MAPQKISQAGSAVDVRIFVDACATGTASAAVASFGDGLADSALAKWLERANEIYGVEMSAAVVGLGE